MDVVFTLKAEADLIAIGDFIAVHNPARAATFLAELVTKCEELADIPLAFPLFASHRSKQIRRRVHRDYLILYRTLGDRVVILHVVRASRDITVCCSAKDDQKHTAASTGPSGVTPARSARASWSSCSICTTSASRPSNFCSSRRWPKKETAQIWP